MSNSPIDPVKFNKEAWNRQVSLSNPWTIPVSTQEIEAARRGEFKIVLTPKKPVPQSWFPNLKDCEVLALACGGGQQGPVLAAVGARVTVLDNSPRQLDRDREVAKRDGLQMNYVEGDMMDLSVFQDAQFDFIFHPCSNSFVPDVNKVWKEAYRVLKPGGTLISGIVNPIIYTLDFELEKQGIAQLKYSIPYSDLTSITEAERIRLLGKDEPISYGHTLDDQIGGQINAGFQIIGFYEDGWDASISPIHRYLNCFIATRALRPLQRI